VVTYYQDIRVYIIPMSSQLNVEDRGVESHVLGRRGKYALSPGVPERGVEVPPLEFGVIDT